MREVLKHELGPILWSLATTNNSLVKTAKLSLHFHLENNTSLLESIPDDSVFIIDAMALLQAITLIPHTFSELANQTLKSVLNISKQAPSVDLVADTYPEHSVKKCRES